MLRTLLLLTTALAIVQRPGTDPSGTLLHNGWRVNPVGNLVPSGDMPLMLEPSPDGDWMLIGTCGYGPHTISAVRIDAPTGRSNDRRFYGRAEHSVTLSHAWRSMKFGRGAQSGILFASGGPRGHVWRLRFDPKGMGLQLLEPLKPPAASFLGGLAILPDGGVAVVDEGGKESDRLMVLDPETGAVRASRDVPLDSGALAASADGRLALADHGTGRVLLLNTDLSTRHEVKTGVQPNFLLFDRSGRRLFVANTGSDTVSVVDAEAGLVTATIRTSMTPRAPLGSVPNALALSPDESVLHVVNGGNNNVAVVSLMENDAVVRGFIPTGRYPVSVQPDPKGTTLFVGYGKGVRSAPNGAFTPGGVGVRVNQTAGRRYGPNRDQDLVHDYILSTLEGGVAKVPTPNPAALARYTRMAVEASPYRDELLVSAKQTVKSALPRSQSQPSPVKHVLYIIKENRTYDQLFGAKAKGKGDPNLVLFGPDVAPNHHKIADEFVLLDNTYCDGEVSQDGWEWSTAANDSDWNTKATLYGYSGRGSVPGSRETIKPSTPYLWEQAEAAGKSSFSYGAKTYGGLFSPTWKGRFSKDWNDARRDGIPDYKKVDIFLKDLAEAERTGVWPNLILMSLTDDHTSGTRPGAPTPYAAVASNDLALGKVVEALTKSRFWKETAILVIEDDAQNGPDHVDAHRTVALVVSPWTRRASVDSTMYTSSGMVRTIQLLLGLPPVTQYDAAANPMFRCFDGPRNLKGYAHLVPQVDLNEKNKPDAPMAALSESLDWSDVDLADFDTLNRILWAALKPGKPYPGTVHGFFRR